MREAHPYSKNELLDDLLRPRRMVFIVNPKAGRQLQKRIRENVEAHLNHHKFEYGIWHTEKPGHAAELAEKAIAEGYEIIVAVGGDGSVNEVATALLHTDVVLGIVPAGSGNGLAMHLGYGRDIAEAIRRLNTAEERTIDVGLLNGRPFVNLAGIGFDGLVSNMMKGQSKRGFLPYFIKSVEAGLTYHAGLCTIESGERSITKNCFAIIVANGPMYGYNFQIAPDAQLDDGLFTVVIMKEVPRWQYFAAVPTLLTGKILEADFVDHFQTDALTIRCAGENYVHLDGEGRVLQDELKIELLPKALKILVPRLEKTL